MIRIVTGVPRAGRDDDAAVDGMMAKAEAEREAKGVDVWGEPIAKPKEAASASEPPWPVIRESEPRRIRVTVERPSERGPGVIAEAVYTTLSDGTVRVEDLEGRRLGTQAVKPGDDPGTVARLLLREKHGKHLSFNDPIPLRPRGIV